MSWRPPLAMSWVHQPMSTVSDDPPTTVDEAPGRTCLTAW